MPLKRRSRVLSSVALVAALLVMLGILGMHMLAGGHGAASSGAHAAPMGITATTPLHHEGHDHAPHALSPAPPLMSSPLTSPGASLPATGDVSCGHQVDAHQECVLAMPVSVLLAATLPVSWRPIWLLLYPAVVEGWRVVEASARSSPLLLLCVCRT